MTLLVILFAMEHIFLNNICREFQSVAMEKMKAGILDGPQMRELMGDELDVQKYCAKINTAFKVIDLCEHDYLGNLSDKYGERFHHDMFASEPEVFFLLRKALYI